MDQPTLLITGASRGMGAAAARIAAQAGANVVLAARSTLVIDELAEEINAAGGGAALALSMDVRAEADCQRVIRQTLDRFERLDAVVNNAGMIEPIAPVYDAKPEIWRENWETNLLGPVMLIQQALPALRDTNGRIINVSSGAAVNVVPGWAAYSTTKSALNHLTRILAEEEPLVTSLGIRPGVVDTDMQATIRQKGKGHMGEENYRFLVNAHTQGELRAPILPGRAIAGLAISTPHEWSGEIVMWDEPRVQQWVDRVLSRG